MIKTKLIFVILSTSILNASAFNLKMVLSNSTLFFSSKGKYQISLDAKSMIKKKAFQKWSMKDVTLNFFDKKTNKISFKLNAENGVYNENLGIWMLSDLKQKKICGMAISSSLYLDQFENLLKSDNGFYLDLDESLDCAN